ncbi:MAG TPA: hypothetical protein VGG74_03515 [Kofleriaceae bacterium]
MKRTFDARDVRAALRAVDVLDAYGIEHRAYGSQLATQQCPSCGQRSRRNVYVDNETGAFHCKAHDCRGDIFALVAGFAGLDIQRDFARVVDVAAEIARLTPSTRVVERARHSATRMTSSTPSMPTVWRMLSRCDERGEDYLRRRGIDPDGLRSAGDIVRYTRNNEPCAALRDLKTGVIVGVQRRRIDLVAGGEPRVLALRGSRVAGTALVGRVAELTADGRDVAIVCEGLADALVATVAWPSCVVFGSPGADSLSRVAAAVAPRVAAIGGWLLVVADDDDAGVRGAANAIVAAERAGLTLDRDLRLVDLDGAHDLADAWRVGWRWCWPDGRRS